MGGELNGVPVKDFAIDTQWQDSASARTGALDENEAAPDTCSHRDFASFDRLGLGLTGHPSRTSPRAPLPAGAHRSGDWRADPGIVANAGTL